MGIIMCRRFLHRMIIVSFTVLGLTTSVDAEVNKDIRFAEAYNKKLAGILYQTREIPGNLEQALAIYKKLDENRIESGGIDWRIARIYWVMASRALDSKERRQLYEKGKYYGTMAVKREPNCSNAHLWNAMILGSASIDQGVVRSFYNKDKIRKGLETALQLDPENTNAYLGLAGWYFYVPELLGGDREKALELTEKALRLDPDYTAAMLLKAEFLVDAGREKEAVSVLEGLIAVRDPKFRCDGVEDKAKAEKMLQVLREARDKE